MPTPDEELGARPSSAPRSRRAMWTVIFVLVGLLALLYAGRLGWLTMMATEGDVPAASAIALPAGVKVIDETSDCASGGCWTTVTVHPPSDQTPETLAEELGATPQLKVSGNLLDPRTVWVSANPSGDALILTLDYWSQEWVP